MLVFRGGTYTKVSYLAKTERFFYLMAALGKTIHPTPTDRYVAQLSRAHRQKKLGNAGKNQ